MTLLSHAKSKTVSTKILDQKKFPGIAGLALQLPPILAAKMSTIVLKNLHLQVKLKTDIFVFLAVLSFQVMA